MPPQSLVIKPPVIKPLVTIAIPCFNAQTTIERAIKSAQNQDWPNIEILIVDDGSDDGSSLIIKKFLREDKRIRLICHETNQGAAVARNTLVENMQGEFIAFFDADDVSYSERVRLQYQRLTNYERESKADLIFCYGGVRIIPLKGESFEKKGIGHRAREPVGWEYVGHYFPVKEAIKKCTWGYCGSGTLFMRGTVFDRIGLFDSALRRSEDIDYAIRAGLKGAHFISVDHPLLDWHITEADYKTDEILLHYHHLMYQKYRYLFSNGFAYFLSLRFAKASVYFYIARARRRYLAIIWYLGQLCFWLFLISPQSFLNKVWAGLDDFFVNRRARKTTLIPRKVGK